MQSKIPLESVKNIYYANHKSRVRSWFVLILVLLLLSAFLPWTQNIKANGSITTLQQEQRPQEIASPIPGKIEKWFVKEGDFVKKGDTILEISEVKEDYLDPNLVGRTQEQVVAKQEAIESYKGKIETTGSQINALMSALQLKIAQIESKLLQQKSKLAAEEAELVAANNGYDIAKDQFDRQQKMFDEGLVSKTKLQDRFSYFQSALAKKTAAENKVAVAKQEFVNLSIEKNSAQQEYAEKISKAQGERFQSQSQVSSEQGNVAKLKNQVSNYTIRNAMYFVTAPQDGQIVQAKKSGIGEILKDGERICIIVPTKIDYAVEMYVRPVDLPLINLGQKVRFMFDGFPAIVFSGWPDGSYGTFAGKVVAYENTISPNGLFRVLVAEDKSEGNWPPQLKIGNGAQGIALLKDVPLYYEVWRNINGFPPDYYQPSPTKSEKSK